MTHGRWSKLTSSQQRIKVAELSGRRRQHFGPGDSNYFWWHPELCPAGALNVIDDSPLDVGLPDYVLDLNAMHEAEKLVPNWTCYTNRLFEVVSGRSIATQSLCRQVCHASASQRAEAFVLTLEPEET